ncbi:alanine racemase [Bacillus alveayuensis]|jgi:alanine racemase|uniref:alanine racemase n=1 Tax=Aeribacillus alveayuensis TaxID=279215 RepID=UPI0005CD0287|nr:alanine racemase [Bacillus alveayuensis]
MTFTYHRDTWVEIDLDAIEHNVKQFKAKLSKNCRFMAVVKADGYGHGAVAVAQAAIKGGADYLGVAFLDEALQLRNACITSPVLILGYTAPAYVEAAIKHDITLTFFSEEVLDSIIQQAKKLGRQAKVHLKVDTGMSRIGVQTKEEALKLAKRASSSDWIMLEGIFTHFADADNRDPSYTNEQFSNFMEVINYLREHGIEIPIKHCCNSAGTMNFPEFHLDMVRIGISLYGLRPSPDVAYESFHLKQALTFKTKIAAIKRVKSGQAISYGCTYKTEHEAIIATVPVGYADGLSRLLSNRGTMTVRNTKVPIVGRVCMDQTMLDVSAIPEAKVGDEVTIFTDGQIDEVAELMGTINYEVVCLIGKRVPRIYRYQNEIMEITNPLS